MKTAISAVLFWLWVPSVAQAGEFVDFKQVWSKIRIDSSEIRAGEAQIKASESASDRSARHWMPGLTLMGRGVHTNDPAQIFFSRLGQRSVDSGDFNPPALNQPGTAQFVSTSLGLQWSLYEGGGGMAHRDLQRSMAELKKIEKDRAELEAYIEAASGYATILHAEETLTSVKGLQSTVQAVLSRYSVGSRSNPVGYSGLLGLKSLLNRIHAVEEQLMTEADAARSRIRALSNEVPVDFQVRKEPVSTFLSVALPEDHLIGGDSLSMNQAEKGVRASEAAVGIDRARALPQFGVFGEGSVITGARSTGAAYSAGVFLKWNLFDPRDFGTLYEKRLERDAAQFRLEGVQAAIRSGQESGLKSLRSIGKNEKLLLESLALMAEQVEVASRLFQSGSIPALQLVEVYNRRLDLLLNFQDLQRQHIQTRTSLARLVSGKGIAQ